MSSTNDPVWITRIASASQALNGPLRGLTFAIKDNIDLAGVPTTAACPGFTYTPTASAHVVEKLIAAGAVPLGKTNLDQFATGLVGTRSPYGAPRNIFNPDYISGGSSSGSAIAVASGQCDFALGTDTAGSGRVPAAFNGLIGLKPTRGRLSTRGVVPACRSLDCVSIFSRDLKTAARVLDVASGFDPADPFSRPAPRPSPLASRPSPIIGVPRADQLEWFGNAESPTLFAAALDRFRALGCSVVEVDFAPFLEAARLLYEGPWTAERYAAVGAFIEKHSATPEAAAAAGLDPTVAKIILGGKSASAVDAFRATYRLAELRRAADQILAGVDTLIAPTTGTIYTVAEIAADPIRLNSNLGRYNNFMNLLDLCGLTVPAGRYSFGPSFGITLIAPAWHDEKLLTLGARYLGETLPTLTTGRAGTPLPAASTSQHPTGAERSPRPTTEAALATPTADPMHRVAVCGAHLSGLPLNSQLTSRGARLVRATTTAPLYKLYALPNTTPPKPGLVRVAENQGGGPIAVEVWELPVSTYGSFVAGIPAPLGIGTLTLVDGETVQGFLCEAAAVQGARDITDLGDWRRYLSSPKI